MLNVKRATSKTWFAHENDVEMICNSGAWRDGCLVGGIGFYFRLGIAFHGFLEFLVDSMGFLFEESEELWNEWIG